MSISKKLLLAAMVSVAPFTVSLAASDTTANVSVDSVYYDYLDKLVGMGYVKTLPNGARPYSRAQLAKWALEAEDVAQEKPMPAYLRDQLDALEAYVAPEIETAKGNKTQDTIRLRSASVEAGYRHADRFDYGYGNVAGSWAPFSANHNGHKYGRNGSLGAAFEVSGNVAPALAVSVKARAGWDKDNDGNASLEEGYVKTRTGSLAFELGREALTWGQGESGHLLLGNNMKPLTTLQVHTNEPVEIGGFFKFLGTVDFHGFYGLSDRDRASDAARRGATDYDHPGLLGLRVDITPSSHLTLGASRVSMMGGKHHGLSHNNWGHWFYGSNSASHDKWDDIGGFDFRLRYSAFQLYGEFMGEDQSGGLPSKWAYRGGVYIPKLTSDGSWDMTLELAHTTDVWYTHSTYQNGWTYSGDIMGDDMGNDATKYFAKVNHYLPGEKQLGLYFQRTERQRNGRPSYAERDVNELGLMGQTKLSHNRYLNGTLGYAHVGGRDSENELFALASMEWKF